MCWLDNVLKVITEVGGAHIWAWLLNLKQKGGICLGNSESEGQKSIPLSSGKEYSVIGVQGGGLPARVAEGRKNDEHWSTVSKTQAPCRSWCILSPLKGPKTFWVSAQTSSLNKNRKQTRKTRGFMMLWGWCKPDCICSKKMKKQQRKHYNLTSGWALACLLPTKAQELKGDMNSLLLQQVWVLEYFPECELICWVKV